MVHHLSILVFVSILALWVAAEPIPWVNPVLESLDEVNDTKIFNAIYKSVKQWEKRQAAKHKHERIKRAEPRACYKDLGCFESSGPFGYLDMLPSTPEEISTKFLLYPGHRKRRSGFNHAEVPFPNVTDAFHWADKGFNKSLDTKVLIHGFGSGCSHVWVYELRSALMAVEEANIICVDWANGAELPNYVKAATNTRLVGKQLAILLKGLVEKTGLSPKKMHLIGFSLGAHVAGFAGAEIANLSRITGLDPAGPLFESQDPRARLDQTDAEYVDVIHSNGENLILGGLGSWQPMGHVDFYPNGGRMQKGCTNLFVGAVSDIIWSSAIEGRSLCNHRRAYKFFTDSISPRCHFPAFTCESYEAFLDGRCFPCTENDNNCGNMGYYADRAKGRGQLYLMTRDEEPFCAHQYLVQIESSSTDIPIVSYGKLQITFVGDVALNETFTMTRKDDDEMKLGQSISRIVVPHPILAEPKQIQVLYTAYSGWISSGLTHWKIDRVLLMDSFGKKSSICRKNLILESGVAITLPLHAGECHHPISASTPDVPHAEERLFSHNASFAPTSVQRPGLFHGDAQESAGNNKEPSIFSFRNAVDIFGWQFGGNTINVDEEKESSRALNTRVVQVTSGPQEEEAIREVVEPVLKPHSGKNARSHDPARSVEISEPILRATTLRAPLTTRRADKPGVQKEIEYNFYDTADGWLPSQHPSTIRTAKWKREDDSEVITDFDYQKPAERDENDIFNLFKTVQFLPQRLARMFEQAEKYTRETILPFISTHTPKIIREFIAPAEVKSRYLPLQFEDTVTATTKGPVARSSSNNKNFNPPPRIPVKLIRSESISNMTTTTPYTHIQKISKKKDTVQLVFAETTPKDTNEKSRDLKVDESRRIEIKIHKAGLPDQQKYIPLS